MEESADNRYAESEINPQLLLTSINFHGQELLRALQVEHGESMMKYVDTRFLNYVEYQKRAQQAEFKFRSKRQRLFNFIAKKADLLFKPITPQTKLLKRNEDETFAALPPIEKYMQVPANDRRSRFFEILKRGDIVIGIVRARNNQMTQQSGGNFIVHLICYDGRRNRYITDLAIKAEIAGGKYTYGTVVRGYIYNHNPSTGKIVLTTTESAEFAYLHQSITLGAITNNELPQRYRICESAAPGISYSDLLDTISAFHNPSAVNNLCLMLGLPVVRCCTSLMKKFQISFPRSDYAVELKKKQMSHWAMRSLREGAKYSKEDKVTDAFTCLNTALRIDPENSDAFVERGTLYVGMDNIEKAIEDFHSALSFDKENKKAKKFLSDIYMGLGQKYAGQGNVNLSCDNFKYAVEYNPSNKDAVSYLNAMLSVKTIEESENAAAAELLERESKDEIKSEKTLLPELSPVSPSVSTATQSKQSASTCASRQEKNFTTYPGPSVKPKAQSTWTTQSPVWHTPTPSTYSDMQPSSWTTSLPTVFPVAPEISANQGVVTIPGLDTLVTSAPLVDTSHSSVANHTADNSQVSPKQSSDLFVLENFFPELNKMIKELKDGQTVRQSRSRSRSDSHSPAQSSPPSSGEKRRKRHSSRRKRRRRRSESYSEESSPSSVSSRVDEHKLKCEEFLEKNRRQMQRNKSHSRESKRRSDKEIKDASSPKRDRRKADSVPKKDDKKVRTSAKDYDKVSPKSSSKKDSYSSKKEKTNDSPVKKVKNVKEVKLRVELSHMKEDDPDFENSDVCEDRYEELSSVEDDEYASNASNEIRKAHLLGSAAEESMDSEFQRQKVVFVFKKGQNALGKKTSDKEFGDKSLARYFGEESEEEEEEEEERERGATRNVMVGNSDKDADPELDEGVFKNSSASFHKRNYRSIQLDEERSVSGHSSVDTDDGCVSKSPIEIKKIYISPERVYEKESHRRESHHSQHRHHCSKHSSGESKHRDYRRKEHSSRYKRRHSDSEDEHYRRRRHKDYTDYRDRRHRH